MIVATAFAFAAQQFPQHRTVRANVQELPVPFLLSRY
jgi:hypothetical protein